MMNLSTTHVVPTRDSVWNLTSFWSEVDKLSKQRDVAGIIQLIYNKVFELAEIEFKDTTTPMHHIRMYMDLLERQLTFNAKSRGYLP
jgi:hypothetical protein